MVRLMPDDPPRYQKLHRKQKRGVRVKQPGFNEMVRRAHQRIVGAVRKKGKGFINATGIKDAVSTLQRWVRNDDGMVGRGNQIYHVLRRAFTELCSAMVFVQRPDGFVLNPHKVVHAAT